MSFLIVILVSEKDAEDDFSVIKIKILWCHVTVYFTITEVFILIFYEIFDSKNFKYLKKSSSIRQGNWSTIC